MLDAFKYGSTGIDSIAVQDSVLQTIRVGKDTIVTYSQLNIVDNIIDEGVGVKKWISQEQFDQIMNDTLKRAAYLGLLYQRLSNIKDNEDITPEGIALVTTKLINTIFELDELRATMKYKVRLGKDLNFQDYYPFIRTTIDFLNILLETPIGQQSFSEKHKELADFPKISDHSLSLFENVFAKNYGEAIQNLVNLFGYIWEVELDEEDWQRQIGDVVSPFYNKNKADKNFDKTIKDYKKSNEKLQKAVLVYGSFMAKVIAAKDPDAVKAAITAVALPPGSSSIKRTSNWDISLNAYVGGGYFRETLLTDEFEGDKTSASFGLSMPIGFTGTWGGIGLNNWSYSLFVPVFDIGTITAFRLGELESEVPEVSFNNFLAPGAFLVVNLPKSPFSISGGIQWGPQARKVTVNGVELTSRARRWVVTATFDVPILNLYSK